jgi:hypothetical protein
MMVNQTIKLELQKILNNNPEKTLLPEEVVTVAKDPSNPLHKEFTWDDTAAAAKYRLEEARNLIRRVYVLLTPNQVKETRALVHIQPAGYKPIEVVLNSRELREQFLTDVIKELERIKMKAQHLTELASVWSAVDKVARTSAQKPKKP